MKRLELHSVFIVVMLLGSVLPGWGAKAAPFRIGCLDHPGSALCRIAVEKGGFHKEGLRVELVTFPDARRGLAALAAGTIDAGAFPVADTLGSIASGTGIRIVAGGGTLVADSPVAELDESGRLETQNQGIVLSIPKQSANKARLTHLVAGVIRAYRTVRTHPDIVAKYAGGSGGLLLFDPNPDYYRLERSWRSLGLQRADMKGDFLAGHVYEEIYCDALDALLDNAADDPVYRELSGKAVCVPDCCPAAKKKT
jgi:hypothetical protein